MVGGDKHRLGRDDWINGALDIMRERGVSGVKVTVLAQRLGVTSGSFYWHFKKLQDLLDAILNHWEHHLTEHIIREAQAFDGPPEQRILNLMIQVIQEGGAEPDNTIAIWSRTDPKVRAAYERTLERRFAFAEWMFLEVGFAHDQAVSRGRLMVAYLIGESLTGLSTRKDRNEIIRRQCDILIGAAS